MRSAVARRDAFLKSMAELGLTVPAEHIVEGNHTMEGGMAAMEQLIALSELPTAVVCSNDMTAIGVLHALLRTTHKVPKDISVVGFDDIHLAQFMLPPLTTVQMSCKDLAAAAVEALRAGIEPDHPKAAKTRVAHSHPAGGAPVHCLFVGSPLGSRARCAVRNLRSICQRGIEGCDSVVWPV
jgi:DNA-binding LacI/PurR family transcriptional regulator